MEFSVYSYIVSLILLWNQLPLIESSINLALNKSTTQSTYYGGYPPSNAVDGQNKDCSSSGFSHTQEGPSEWWQVDLGEVCEIKTINIYYRIGFKNRLDGYAIDIIKSFDPLETWQCYKDTDSRQPTSLTPSHECGRLGQYVKFSRDIPGDSAVINLCELEVYGCPQGFYGHGNCNSHCSVDCIQSRCDPDNGYCEKIKCSSGRYFDGAMCIPCSRGCLYSNCNPMNGECLNGCNPSLYGTFCNLTCPKDCYNTSCGRDNAECIGCKTGMYGSKCDVTCPQNCKDNFCRQDSGYCTSCNYPYKGFSCTDCIAGSYINGATCIPCSTGCIDNNCNSGTGKCLFGCKQPFYGTFCNLTCSTKCYNTSCGRDNGECFGCKTGLHGSKCNSICPRNCKDNVCKQDNGYCTRCNHLYKGITCTECIDGFYGDKCKNCSDGCLDRKCDQKHGHCTCKESFYGNTCNQSCPENCKNAKCNQTTGDCVDGCKTLSFKGEKCNECADGKYGENCDNDCPSNCNLTRCYKTDGLCSDGCKHKNMIGSKCDVLASVSTGNSESQTQTNNTGLIVGVIVAVIVVIVIAVIILMFLKRRRHNPGKENEYENQITFSLSNPNHESKDKQKNEPGNTNTFKESVVSVENGNEYCNSPEVYMNLTLTEVPISGLSSIISKKTAEKEFESEYEKLPKGSKHPTTVGKHPDNKIKNRFLTTFPYDHSRVVLKPISTQQKSDYINANYIDGAEIRRAYIATQGPKTSTLFDFWKMVWQEKSGKIVMLTNLIENEKPKCEQYWPDIGQEKDFGTLKVTLESEKEYAFFVERTLQLTNKKTKEIRQILQFHYTMWPDHGTPDPVQLMLFHRKVKEVTTTLTGPPIIHCAAGIGRTGTFIALDTLHDYGDKTGRIDIFEYVIRMRKDRMNMIQTLEQYVVLHEALLESFQYTGRSLRRNKFSEVCSELNKARPKNQTHVYKEFQNLSALRPVYGIESYDSALEKDNRRKSRNQNILAVEKYRPFLMSQHSSRNNFINAVMLPTFRKKCGYFVTHYPLENTVVDFWCLVFDHDSSTVVVLDEISDKDNVLHWYPDNETEMAVDSFQIKKVSGPHINGRMREIEFSVTHHDDEKSVRMLMIRPWPTERCVPPDKNDLVKLIEMALERQASDSGPVTIVCSDGARCCGLFCTVCNVILNLRIEDEIDIFHTVRQLQIRRPQFITDYEEYKSCYEMVQLFLESSSAGVYANV